MPMAGRCSAASATTGRRGISPSRNRRPATSIPCVNLPACTLAFLTAVFRAITASQEPATTPFAVASVLGIMSKHIAVLAGEIRLAQLLVLAHTAMR